LGSGSAGHYVKMVHNGIEYGLMQLIAETYALMKQGLQLSDDELGEVYDQWNRGELNSFLLEITAHIFRQVDEKRGGRLIDAFLAQLRGALYAATIITYAQGMALLRRGSLAHGYGLNLETVARIWRGGCIIRAAALEEIRAAFRVQPEPANLLLAPQAAQAV